MSVAAKCDGKTLPLPFKGNMGTLALEWFLKNPERGKVPLFCSRTTPAATNRCRWRTSARVRSIASRYGIVLYFDACRFAANAWFIHEREHGFARRSIPDMVKEMFSYADGCLFSAKKDGLAHMGGFFATRSERVAKRAQEQGCSPRDF